jgi:hypothetical protein
VAFGPRQAGSLAAAAALACIAAGATAAALSPSAYRAQANAICQHAKAQVVALPHPKTHRQVGVYLESSLPIVRGEYTKLHGLDVPPALQAAHAQALAAFTKEVDLLAGVVAQIHRGADPVRAFAAIDAREVALGKVEDAGWRKAGVTACVG